MRAAALVLASWPLLAPGPQAASRPFREGEYRYRIVGKVRLLLFWVGSDEVGGARVTLSRATDDSRSIALLIGSDPQRAPRGINEWGYIREELRSNGADVFGVRTLTDADSLEEAEARLSDGATEALFGVLCSRVTATAASSSTTTVRVDRNVTYRHFEALLDTLARSTRWNHLRTTRPDLAEAGFLVAVERLIRVSLDAGLPGERNGQASLTVPYVYKDGLYDLRLTRAERLRELRVRFRRFDNVVHSDFSVVNRRTKAATSFSVTYGADGLLAGVPIEATYQPNWWFKVELELDDQVDVAADPAGDEAQLARIKAICADAEGRR